jgi:hypothetical protein
MRQIK